MSKRLTIVGGGYIGATVAKALERHADVTLIEQRSHFVHTPAMIRAVVDPSLLDRALIPYDRLLKRGTLIRETATSIDEAGFVLANGTCIDSDVTLLATGSENATPFKAHGSDIDGLRADNARIHAQLLDARSIAIIGAGPVGIELAGEIAHFMPDKSITLISAHPTLFPNLPAALGRSLQKKLEAAGITLIFSARAENLPGTNEPYSGSVTLSTGQQIRADLIFPVTGSRPCAELLSGLPDATRDSTGRVKVDKWLRPSSLPNVFAAGDAANTGDAMTIVGASRQAPWLIKTLKAVLNGQRTEDRKPYTPWNRAPILIPLGPYQGNSYLSLFTAGSFLTRVMKGKDLFLGKYHRLLNRS